MKSVLFILNPISGTVNKENIEVLVERVMDKSRYKWDLVYTEYAGHAEKIAREAAGRNVDVVVAVGGDGTVNEVARGLVKTDTALAIIPCGSGNGLARHLMLPMSPKRAIEVINAMEVHKLDYGVVDNHPFLCTCGIGFDAFIAEKFASAGKRGMMTYVEKIFKDGLGYESETYEYILDDQEPVKQEAWLISCANASQYGNDAYIAPQASMKDGELDIVIMDPVGIQNVVSVNMEMVNKTLDKNQNIHTFKGKKLTVKRQQPGYIHFDGEPAMAPAVVEIELVEQGINIVVNGNANKKKRRPNMFQLAMSEFFNDVDTLNKAIVQRSQDLLEQGKSLQKDIVEKSKDIQKDIVEKGKNIHKLNQEILNKLTGK
ncbi:MAG: YegS/Rv2252/BmrU family lipid kinase [Bacteroidaceae bacterium]|nr:YegS/Rv2252/BmrU family lipid kinase [Bacteroidaceae bacterium]